VIATEFEELIELCKQAVIKAYRFIEGKEAEDRPWLEVHVDPYKCYKRYRVQLFVLEGTPAKGYVLVDYGRKRVQAFDSDGERLLEFDADDSLSDFLHLYERRLAEYEKRLAEHS
jgi:hypothetical protein